MIQKCKKTKILYLIFLMSFLNIYSSINVEKEANIMSASFLLKDKDSLFLIQYRKTKILFENKNYDVALESALTLRDLSIKKKSSNIEYLTTVLIGRIFKETNNIDKSLKYYKQALVLRLKYNNNLDENINISNDYLLAENLLMIASSYQLLQENDSAKHYYNKILSLNSLNEEILTFKARTYTNLSEIYHENFLYDKAKSSLLEAIEINKKQNNKLFLSESLSNLANIYLEENNLDKAKEYYFEAIKLIENEKNSKALKDRELFYDNLAYTLYMQKNYTAYEYLDKSFTIRDSLREVEVTDILAEIEAKHSYKNEKSFEVAKRLKDQRTFMIYGIGSFIIILSLLYGLNFYKLRQKNLRLKLSQTQLLQNQNIEKLRSESQARILNATIDGKESERKEIAETLHDSVSALLSSANLHLMATKSQFKGEVPIEINKTQDIIAEASQKIRDLSHTLVSSVLLKFGLNYALKDMASKYSNSVLQIDTDIYDIRRYHQNFEIKIYNIIQEFVNNILKHSKAENTIIKLHEKNNRICFQITDDGVGFDKTKVFNKDGLGLNQIDARIQMMNGKFLIESVIGEGTTVFVELPIVEKNTINHV